jgi:lipoprotein-releasing system permease protein
MVRGRLTDLKAGEFGIVLGQDLADALNVRIGQTIMMLAPSANISPAGFSPRMRQFTLVGTFRSGHYEYDSSLAFVDVTDAAKLFRDSAMAGVRLRVNDMHRAPEIAQALVPLLPATVAVADWSRNNRTWFAAVQTEKRMMFLILALIVAGLRGGGWQGNAADLRCVEIGGGMIAAATVAAQLLARAFQMPEDR